MESFGLLKSGSAGLLKHGEIEYKIKEVREAVNALESAIFNLVEPFEDELRSAECDYDELEMDMEELAEAV